MYFLRKNITKQATIRRSETPVSLAVTRTNCRSRELVDRRRFRNKSAFNKIRNQKRDRIGGIGVYNNWWTVNQMIYPANVLNYQPAPK